MVEGAFSPLREGACQPLGCRGFGVKIGHSYPNGSSSPFRRINFIAPPDQSATSVDAAFSAEMTLSIDAGLQSHFFDRARRPQRRQM